MKLFNLFEKIKTNEDAIQYLIEEEVVSPDRKCWRCKKFMKINIKEHMYRCHRCGRKKSIFATSFLTNCKMQVKDLLLLCYLYLV